MDGSSAHGASSCKFIGYTNDTVHVELLPTACLARAGDESHPNHAQSSNPHRPIRRRLRTETFHAARDSRRNLILQYRATNAAKGIVHLHYRGR
ncbi:hypothetical protein Cenrod_1643 [Candidatus Symbiobacter mobilis CR]|uniref:Uncharacterized protein n=1 Tax=Candidatus Symbiobacter mobilis CR TaxID=946483 RepID=U5NBV8_9BURK|nr:hypothetical protein Cenrod_1643 [Candidatus Symbiobacter mobilis CR]